MEVMEGVGEGTLLERVIWGIIGVMGAAIMETGAGVLMDMGGFITEAGLGVSGGGMGMKVTERGSGGVLIGRNSRGVDCVTDVTSLGTLRENVREKRNERKGVFLCTDS